MLADPPLITINAVIHMTSLSRATIYRRIAEKAFPKQIDLGGRRVAFRRLDIERWIENPREFCIEGRVSS